MISRRSRSHARTVNKPRPLSTLINYSPPLDPILWLVLSQCYCIAIAACIRPISIRPTIPFPRATAAWEATATTALVVGYDRSFLLGPPPSPCPALDLCLCDSSLPAVSPCRVALLPFGHWLLSLAPHAVRTIHTALAACWSRGRKPGREEGVEPLSVTARDSKQRVGATIASNSRDSGTRGQGQ